MKNVSSSTRYYIWSFEHNGWWRPHRHGYTQDIKEAGEYNFNNAFLIVQECNSYGEIKEAIVPVKMEPRDANELDKYTKQSR